MTTMLSLEDLIADCARRAERCELCELWARECRRGKRWWRHECLRKQAIRHRNDRANFEHELRLARHRAGAPLTMNGHILEAESV